MGLRRLLGGGPEALHPSVLALAAVAILGSIVSGSYTAAMSRSAAGPARLSIQGALSVAARTADHGLVHTARDAFTTAMSTSFIAAACSVLGGVVLALLRAGQPGRADLAPASVVREPVTAGSGAAGPAH